MLTLVRDLFEQTGRHLGGVNNANLNGVRASFPGSNARHAIDGTDETLAVTDLVSLSAFDDGVYCGFDLIVVQHDLQFYLG